MKKTTVILFAFVCFSFFCQGQRQANLLIDQLYEIQDKEEDAIEKSIRLLHQELPSYTSPDLEIAHLIMAQSLSEFYLMEHDNLPAFNMSLDSNLFYTSLREFSKEYMVKKIIHHLHCANKSQYPYLKDEDLQSLIQRSKRKPFYPFCLAEIIYHKSVEILRNIEHVGINPQLSFLRPFSMESELRFLSEQLRTYFIENPRKRISDYSPFLQLELSELQTLQPRRNQNDQHQKDYLDDLHALLTKYTKASNLGDVYYEIAQTLEYTEPKKALEYAKTAVEEYPNSLGAINAGILINRIEKEEFQIQLLYTYPVNQPISMVAQIKNAPHLYFRIYQLTPVGEEAFQQSENRKEWLNAFLPEKKVLHQLQKDFDTALLNDFKTHLTYIDLPPLPQGFYILAASSLPDFPADRIQYAEFYSSQLKLVLNSQNEGYVLDLLSGAPIANASVEIHSKQYDYEKRDFIHREESSVQTNRKGYFKIPHDIISPEHQQDIHTFLRLKIRKGQDYITPKEKIYLQDPTKDAVPQYTITWIYNQPIYRLGETIHVKGIVTSSKNGKYELAVNKSFNGVLGNPQGKVIQKFSIKTDSLGAFYLSYTLPLNDENGLWNLRLAELDELRKNIAAQHMLNIRVEEYTVPAFRIDLKEIFDENPLNYHVEGLLESFTGVPLISTSVDYQVNLYERGWFHGQHNLIGSISGKTKSDASGKFEIEFKDFQKTAIQPHSLYLYEVTCYAKNIQNEVCIHKLEMPAHRDRSRIVCDIPEMISKQDLPDIPIYKCDRNGNRQDEDVFVKIYRLEKGVDENCFQRDLFDVTPDLHSISEEKFRQLFPSDPYYPASVRDSLLKKTLVMEALVHPEEGILPSLDILGNGYYELQSGPNFKRRFLLLDENEKTALSNKDFYVYSVSASPNQLRFIVGSPWKIRLVVQVANGQEEVETHYLTLNNEQKVWEIKPKISTQHLWKTIFFAQLQQRFYHERVVSTLPLKNQNFKVVCDIPQSLPTDSLFEWKLRILPQNGETMNFNHTMFGIGLYDAATESLSSAIPWQTLSKEGISALIPMESMPNNPWRFLTQTGKPQFSVSYHYAYAPMPEQNQAPRLRWEGFFGRRRVMQLFSTINPSSALGKESEDGQVVANELETLQQEYTIRNNFQSSAFFYPFVPVNEKGEISFKAPTPHNFSTWKLHFFGYDNLLNTVSGDTTLLIKNALMVEPNHPPFIFEGDSISLSCKLSLEDDLSASEMENGQMKVFVRWIHADSTQNFTEVQNHPVRWKAVNSSFAESQVTIPITVPEGYSQLEINYFTRWKNRRDALSDRISIYSRKTQHKESRSVFIAPGKKKKIPLRMNSDANAEINNICFHFTLQPYSKIFDWLHEIEVNSDKTSTEAVTALSIAALEDDDKGLETHWRNLQKFKGYGGGFSWTPQGTSDLYVSLSILTSMQEWMPKRILPNQQAFLASIRKFVNESQERYQMQVASDSNFTLSPKDLLFIHWGSLRMTPNHLYYSVWKFFTQKAIQEQSNLSLKNKALLALALFNQGREEDLQKLLAIIDKTALVSEEKGRYWNDKNMGYSLNERVETASYLCRLYAKLGDTLKAQQILQWVLCQERSVDFSAASAHVHPNHLIRLGFVIKNLFPTLQSKDTTADLGQVKFQLDTLQWTTTSSDQQCFEHPNPKVMKQPLLLQWTPSKQSGSFTSFGGVDVEYTVNIDDVPEFEGDELKIKKACSIRGTSSYLKNNTIKTGDIIHVELHITADRDFSYIQICDSRAAGLSFATPTSGYGHQGRISYYRNVGKDKIRYYIPFLPKGHHRLAYDLKAEQIGVFLFDAAEIFSSYNPNFRSNTAGGVVRVLKAEE